MKSTWLVGAVISVCAVTLAAGCSRSRKASAGPASTPPARPKRVALPETSGPPTGQFVPVPAGGDLNLQAILGRWAPKVETRVEMVDGPWATARLGQYATYRGRGGVAMTRKVVHADDESVTVDVTVSSGQSRITRQARFLRRVPTRQNARRVPVTARWGEETITIAGKQLTCRVAAWQEDSRRGRLHKVWLSDAVPGQLVRSMLSDPGGGPGSEVTIQELVEFGG